jgi:hypothetical protein
MKLVLTYSWGSEPCSGTSYLPFEYESREKFIYDVLEKYKDKEWEDYGDKTYSYPEQVEIFEDVYMTKYDIDGIEHIVHTLEDWFKLNENKFEL